MRTQHQTTGSQNPEGREPDSFDRDLNPHNPLDGQNAGGASRTDEMDVPRAYDIKEFHDAFPDLSSDELKALPILSPGMRLEQGATYLDLKNPDREEFVARSEMTVSESQWLVPKKFVDYELYNRLRGVQHPGSQESA